MFWSVPIPKIDIAWAASSRIPLWSITQHHAERSRPAAFPAEEHIGGDVESRGHRQGLVDGFDSRMVGVLRPLELDGASVQEQLAGIGDECRPSGT